MFDVMAFQAAQRARVADDPIRLYPARVAICDALATIRSLLSVHPILRRDPEVAVRLRALCGEASR